MTDQETARAVIEKVKAELTPIWLGGRQRLMLEREIAHALAAEREACVKVIRDVAFLYGNDKWRERQALMEVADHIVDANKKADAIRTRGR